MNQTSTPVLRRACVRGRASVRHVGRTATVVALAASAAMFAGCSTWQGMSRADQGTVIGAGVGGVAGNAASGGSVLGTVGGAAVGGVIGREVSKDRR